MISPYFPSSLVEIITTQNCNMRCSYCFEKDKTKKNIAMEQSDKISEELFFKECRFIGGEPLLNPDFIEKTFDNIMSNYMDPAFKKRFLENSCIFTNGTLIKQNIRLLKKMNILVVISIDGDRNTNDIDRVYKDGSGTFDDIMESVKLLSENNIPWYFAVTLSKQKIPYYFDIFKFLWTTRKNNSKNIDEAIDLIVHSINGVITNAEYTDHDIDVFLEQQKLIFDYINELDIDNQRKRLLMINWFTKALEPEWGCKATSGRVAIAENGKVYPCLSIGLFKDRDLYSDYKAFNLFGHYNKQAVAVSSCLDGSREYNPFWNKSCPAHNIRSSDSIYYQNCKFNVLVAEYNRFVIQLFNENGIL